MLDDRRFDQIELIKEPHDLHAPVRSATRERSSASLFKRLLAYLTDLSLFVALGLALTPLLPQSQEWSVTERNEWIPVAAVVAFLLLLSFYYFVGSWVLWGKTIGAAIFDVTVVEDNGTHIRIGSAVKRWLWLIVTTLTAGVTSVLALSPSRKSLADRLSGTRSVDG